MSTGDEDKHWRRGSDYVPGNRGRTQQPTDRGTTCHQQASKDTTRNTTEAQRVRRVAPKTDKQKRRTSATRHGTTSCWEEFSIGIEISAIYIKETRFIAAIYYGWLLFYHWIFIHWHLWRIHILHSILHIVCGRSKNTCLFSYITIALKKPNALRNFTWKF